MFIGIIGNKRSGKDYFADLLNKKTGFKIVHFADPLKNILCNTFNISLDELDNLKNNPDIQIFNNLNMRQILQNFGTDAMQDIFGKNVWVQMVLVKSENLIIPDVRFIHEAEEVIKNGFLIRLYGGEENDPHKSETELNLIPNDWIQYNFDNSQKNSDINLFVEYIYNELWKK